MIPTNPFQEIKNAFNTAMDKLNGRAPSILRIPEDTADRALQQEYEKIENLFHPGTEEEWNQRKELSEEIGSRAFSPGLNIDSKSQEPYLVEEFKDKILNYAGRVGIVVGKNCAAWDGKNKKWLKI